MDAIDSCNPTNLEERRKKMNDSGKNVETKYVVQDHHLIKALQYSIRKSHHERNILNVTTTIRQNIYSLKVFQQSFSK